MVLSLDAAAVAEVGRALARDRAVMPRADALVRQLGAPSWILTFGEDGRLRAVTVLGDRQSLLPPAATARVPAPPSGPLERAFALPPHGALARALGASTATGQQLADLALRQNDPELRAEAVRVAVEAAMRDPGLESALLAAFDGIDDRTLAGGLASVAGDGAAGLVSLVVEQARGRPLGLRARRVLAQLGRTP
ncbi:MAG: hypothetical protein ACREQL_08655 [Candidatus Binatia bacterium]